MLFLNFDSNGRAKMTATAPSGAVFFGGSAYNSAGALHVSSATPASTDPRIGGVAHKPTGEAYVTTATSASDVYHNGLRLSTSGQLVVSSLGTVANSQGGLPFNSSGAVVAAVDSSGEAADYDGTNDYATRGSDLTGMADGKTGTFSGWVRVDGGDGATRAILESTTLVGGNVARLVPFLNASNQFQISALNAASATILVIRTNATFTAGAAWRHFMASWDLTDTGKRHLYVNDTSDLVVSTYTNDTIDYTAGDWAVGGRPDGALLWNGCISELFFHPTYIDLSVEANRRKFVTAAGKPACGIL